MLPLLLIAILLVALGISWLCVYLVHLGETVPAARRFSDLAVPLLFGVMLIAEWELVTRGFGVPEILLPAPSVILSAAANALPTLWEDVVQTFFKSVLSGYVVGCGLGFLAALVINRSGFLKRGLLPLGSFVSALPIVGVAPIAVMWFGFDWQSKAAVIVLMTFFPMLVNTEAGLAAAGHMERDLMRTYAATWGDEMRRLRLPAAWPFVFNALKINSTLALIGAIVAEFFGSPTAGLGFRISTEAARMNMPLVWAAIVLASVTGSVLYALLSVLERRVNFWHPAFRSR